MNNDKNAIRVDNAGLCLLAFCFPRLFSMLGYLDDKKNFKDTESQIRAVFLLQYLICLEEKEYNEPELELNRLFVSLPISVALPKTFILNNEEKQIANSLLEGVKGNWDKMRNTSLEGFQRSFISRSGWLEEQDETYMLTVDEKVYDILLDSVPWPYRMCRFPWIKKTIMINWR